MPRSVRPQAAPLQRLARDVKMSRVKMVGANMTGTKMTGAKMTGGQMNRGRLSGIGARVSGSCGHGPIGQTLNQRAVV